MSFLDEILTSKQITLIQLIEAIKAENPMLIDTRPQPLTRFTNYTLKRYREEVLKLTQAELAKRINKQLAYWGVSDQGMITQKLISEWELSKVAFVYSPRKSWVIRNTYGLTEDEWVDMIDYTQNNQKK